MNGLGIESLDGPAVRKSRLAPGWKMKRSLKPGFVVQRRGISALLAVVLASVNAGLPAAAQEAGQRTVPDTARAIHLLARATWGPRPADIEALLAAGADAWLERQLTPATGLDPSLMVRLERFPRATLPVADLIRDHAPPRPREPAQGDSIGRAALTQAERRERALRSPQRILIDLVGAKLTRAVHSERQLEEMMTDFWFNHFNVFFNKGLDRYLIGDYERSAIRPNVFGRFETMLRATAAHPAMLFYLDNITNLAPDSMVAARRQRQTAQPRSRERGINENYARELLELHTLGVDGGYTQDDVVAVARAFTGWTIERNGGGGRMSAMEEAVAPRFIFRPMLHDVGAKSVLGRSLAPGRGMEDGQDVLHLLATHPSTARHVARKLVERFVSDAGDAALEDTLAAVFLRTGGDLREVTRTLFTADRFYATEHRRSKVKTPFELVASTLRVTHADLGPSPDVINTLRAMGQLPYTESAPTGFPASSADWVSSSAMLARMNFALDLSAGRLRGVRVDGSRLSGGATGPAALTALIETALPGIASAPIEARILEDLATQTDGNRRSLGVRATGLVLGSPEFQRR